jgi:hypothetical protein
MTGSELISETVELTSEMMDQNPNWRFGQAFFNALHKIDPEFSEEIRGTKYDPFHNDDKITTCMAYIRKNKK